MSTEGDIFNALKALVDNGDGTYRCYPDTAPLGTGADYIIYQQVGGSVAVYLEGAIGKHLPRIQIACWSETRTAASALARSAEAAMVGTLKANPIGDFAADYDEEVNLYGTRQDFSLAT